LNSEKIFFEPIHKNQYLLIAQKIVSKNMDLGCEILDPEKSLFLIPDPVVKKAPDPGSASAKLTVGSNRFVNDI
jgi:hypothetical protein